MARAKKNVTTDPSDKLDKLTESYLNKLVPLHLKAELGDIEFDREDIEGIVDLAFVPIREIVLSLVSSVAIGYVGQMDD